MDPKIDTFGQVDIRVLAILGIGKVVFWTFSKLLRSCLESVWALFFFYLKVLPFWVLLAQKFDKLPQKTKIPFKNWLILGVILTVLWVKKVVFWTFSKYFRCSLRWVSELFLTLKGLLLGELSARKVAKWPRKSKFSVNNLLILAL